MDGLLGRSNTSFTSGLFKSTGYGWWLSKLTLAIIASSTCEFGEGPKSAVTRKFYLSCLSWECGIWTTLPGYFFFLLSAIMLNYN